MVTGQRYWIALSIAVLTVGACRQASRPDTDPGPAAAPAGGAVEQRQSGLTALSRSGWVASASPAGGTGETADKAIDGTATSRWRSGVGQATNQFFQVDMAAARRFVEIRLDTTATATEYPRSFKVQVANDNVSWATASTVAAGTGTAFMTIALAPQMARYIRVTLTGGDTAFWSIHEFNVYDDSLPRTGWTATASSTASGTTTGGALDSSIATRWSSVSGTSHQFQVDMLSAQLFDQVTLDAGAATAGNVPRSYTVSVSSDGTTFTSAATGTGTSRVVVINFPMKQARHIRINTTNGTAFTWSIEEMTVGPATVATTYVRTGWTATAFTNSGNAGLALDGNTGTSWTSTGGETNQFIQVDMQTFRMFTQVTVDAGASVTPRTYQLQVGNSSTGPWTTVVSNVSGTAATVTISVPPQTSRFIKINQTATSTTNWSVRELNVAGPALSRAGWVASASPSSTTDVPANAIDGTATSRWDSGANQAVTTPPQTFTLDMGAAHVVNQLTLDAGTSTGNYPRGYSVNLSNDGTNWGTAVATGTGSTQIVTINFLTQSARFIQIAQTGTASANHWSIHEINVWRINQPCETVTCTASDQCHVAGVCDANTGVCSNPNKTNGSTCNDNSLCTTMDACQNGTCTGTTVTCAADACHTGAACVPATGCPIRTNGTACDDGNACTNSTTCTAGVCGGGTTVTCTALDQCHVAGTCSPTTGCSNPNKANGTTCNDNSLCTTMDACQNGTCTGAAVTCTADACHTGAACVPGSGCPIRTNGTACDDGNVCTNNTTCTNGNCTGGTAVTCTADACHTGGTCVPGSGCPIKTNGTTCNDGMACTTMDACQNGTCTGTAVTCAASDQCHNAGTCNPATGVCSNPNKTNGTTCNDGNLCTTSDACQNGACTGTAVTCTADACHNAGTCVPGTGCPIKANGTACDDGNACTNNTTCTNGTCGGATPFTCVAIDSCQDPGTCNPSKPSPQPLMDWSLVGWWKMEGDGADASGGGHPLTNDGAVAAPGRFGLGMKFDGSSCMTRPVWDSNGNSLWPEARMFDGVFTLMAWVSPSDQYICPSPENTVVGNGRDYSMGTSCPFGSPPGPAVVGERTSDNGDYTFVGYGAAPRNEWTHVAVTYDRSTLTVYINGKVAYLRPADGEVNDTEMTFGVGCMITELTGAEKTRGFRGTIDEVVAYERTLTAQDIWAYYASADPCVHPTHPNGSACTDNDYCTQTDACQAGVCVGSNPLVCPAAGPCTGAMACIPTEGCTAFAKPNGASCDDGNACTNSTTCTSGVCGGGTALACSMDACHPGGACVPASGCPVKPNGTTCDDGNACTSSTTCTNGNCGGGAAVTCTGDACHTVGTCMPATGCPIKPNGIVCNDGNACTQSETCQAGVCLPPAAVPPVLNLALDDVAAAGTLGGTYNTAEDVNAGGWIVGNATKANGEMHAYVRTGTGPMVDLTPNRPSAAAAVNDGGFVAGTLTSSGGNSAYRFDPGTGVAQDLGFAAGLGGDVSVATDVFQFQGAYAYEINAGGQVAGIFTRQGTINAFRFTDSVGMEEVPPLAGGTTRASGLSAAGTVVGSSWVPGTPATGFRRLGHAFRFDDGLVDSIDLNGYVLPNFADPNDVWTLISASDVVNNYVVGGGDHNGAIHAYRLNMTTGVVDDLSGGWQGSTFANGTNAAGDVVGSGNMNADETGQAAFVYTDSLGFKKLNDMIDPTSGWDLRVANSINPSGDIVGWGYHNGQVSPFHLHLPPGQSAICKARNTCGGGDGDAICLFSDGVIEVSEGHFVAVFGFDNAASTSVHPNVNEVRIDDGNPLANPQPAPPAYLPPGTHNGAYLAKFDAGHKISWTVNGETVSADSSPSTPRLHPVPIGQTGFGVVIGGQTIVLQADTAQYAATPGETRPAADREVGAEYNGALTGALSVSPTGAATYTVPIMKPPGIQGMAPSLNLVYSSQGGDGIAGQGWELTGLSIIHRCPKTWVQDGYNRPVKMDSIMYAETSGFGLNHPLHTYRDGVCLDGKRMFEKDGAPNSYSMEIDDASTITREFVDGVHSDQAMYFKIVTKTGETRIYGSRSDARVTNDISLPQTAIWALERVIDAAGNYFDVVYNDDHAQQGLLVKHIDYTGHFLGAKYDGLTGAQTNVAGFAPPHSIVFNYEARDDVRHLRFGPFSVLKNKRLHSIVTPMGSYELSYMDPDALMPSRLQRVRYCAKPGEIPPIGVPLLQCLTDLEFDWEGGGYKWVETPAYALPESIELFMDSDPRLPRSPGAQFMDLDGDGRVDFVKSRDGQPAKAWKNTGHSWEPAPDEWALPNSLYTSDGRRTGALLADVDGDGLLDMVGFTRTVCGEPQSDCGRKAAFWFNRIRTEGRWVPDDGTFGSPDFTIGSRTLDPIFNSPNFMANDAVVDMNGDGRADFSRIGTSQYEIAVALSTPNGWAPKQFLVTDAWTVNQGNIHVEDINRDGLGDIVPNAPHPQGGHLLNLGSIVTGHRWEANPGDPAQMAPPGTHYRGDIDGDGLYDSVTFYESWSSPPIATGVAMSTGAGYTTSGAEAYLAAMMPYSPAPDPDPARYPPVSKMFNLADINGDGLADLLVENNHGYYGGGVSGNELAAQVLINTGTTWVPLPDTGHGMGPDSNLAPLVPHELNPFATPGATEGLESNGAAFVDLDGDGIVDMVQSEGTRTGESKAWLNKFRRPRIKNFTNGPARKTEVSYVITTVDPQTVGNVYRDTSPVVEGTRLMAVPVTVVSSIGTDDGLGFGGTATTSYFYRSMRAGGTGRGPQGFGMTISLDPSGLETITTYLQAFPYSGLPRTVSRFRGLSGSSIPISDSTTNYCDRIGVQPSCTPMTGASFQAPLDPRSSYFVYPVQVQDTTYVHTDYSVTGQIKATSYLTYGPHNNLVEAAVETTNITDANPHGDKFSKVTTNTYGTANSLEERMGRVTRTVIKTKQVIPAGAESTHVTEFKYATVSHFNVAPNGIRIDTLGLRTKMEESGAGWPVEQHTAYAYDGMGNVETTTICGNDYENGGCRPGAIGPNATGDPRHLNFRTSRISYDPGDFNAPAGIGSDLTSTINYKPGYFPVRTTNAVGHVEYFAYDAAKGMLLQETDPNGVHSCFKYDDLGRQRKEILRCGSGAQIETGITYNSATDADPFPASTVKVTRQPTGQVSWAYSDVLGREVGTVAKSFNGSYNETYSIYDNLGRLGRQSKPFKTGQNMFFTTTIYDAFGRVSSVEDELGPIDGSAFPDRRTTNNQYMGWMIQTTQWVGGKLQQRTETKNSLGKVVWVQSKVNDTASSLIMFDYDPDGNLIATGDPFGINAIPTVRIDYDNRGRRKHVIDPDMGTTAYDYNGFGEVISKTDARNQVTSYIYDELGRLTRQTDDTGAAQWLYDVEPGGMGKLVAMVSAPDPRLKAPCQTRNLTFTDGNRAAREFTFTPFGEISESSDCIDGEKFVTNYQYDAVGRQSLVSYPDIDGNRLAIEYHYTTLGYLHFLSDKADDSVYWAATEMNAQDKVSREYTRNGVETISDRNPSTGWLMNSYSVSRASNNEVINGWSHHYDQVGNLRYRARVDATTGNAYEEGFDYDQANRLTAFYRMTPTQVSESYVYDILGNLKWKGSTGYTYEGCMAETRAAGPHAVCTAGAASYRYDDNGNMVTGNQRSLTYNPNNKPIHIESTPDNPQGNDAGMIDFIYGADGNRIVQLARPLPGASGPSARTLYVGLGGTGKSLYERTTRDDQRVEHTQFIYAAGLHNGNAFALRVVTKQGTSEPTVATKYNHFDHLGSITAMSDEAGHVVTPEWGGADATVMDYDPWGARRTQSGQVASPAAFNLPAGHRGFTGHETIPNVGLVNMNGRVYDPLLGRFLTPDPNVQVVTNLQTYNRYSYVLNNPLSYTDPTGFQTVTGSSSADLAIGLGLAVIGIAACPETGGGGCVFALWIAAVWNTTVMVANGASWEQIVAVNIAGAAAGLIGQGIGEALGQSFEAALVTGAATGAISTVMTDLALGRMPGWDVLQGAAVGTVMGGVSWGIRNATQVSDASLEDEGTRRAKGPKVKHGGKGYEVVKSTTPEQEKIINERFRGSFKDIDTKLEALSRWNAKDRAWFEANFGRATESARETVRTGLINMKNNEVNFTVFLKHYYVPDTTDYAYVLQSEPGKMYFGPNFFKQSASMQELTIIHEMSHFNVVAGTNTVLENDFYEDDARKLAQYDRLMGTSYTLDNADNWAYYVSGVKMP